MDGKELIRRAAGRGCGGDLVKSPMVRNPARWHEVGPRETHELGPASVWASLQRRL